METKSDGALFYIMRDAGSAAWFAHEMGDAIGEAKYLDQMLDAASEINRRRRIAKGDA